MLLTRANLILAVVLITSACSSVTEKPPSKRVLEAMELIQDGKPKQLDDYVLIKDISETGILYGMMSTAFSQNGGVSRFEIESEKIEGESASVTLRWYYKDGNSEHNTFRLEREDGNWRIEL